MRFGRRKIEVSTPYESPAAPGVVQLLLFLLGVYCFPLLFLSIAGLRYPALALYLCAGLLGLLLWLAAWCGAFPALGMSGLTLVVLGWIGFRLRETIVPQLQAFGAFVTDSTPVVATSPLTITESLFLFTGFWILLLFVLEFLLQNHIVPWVLTTLLLLLPPRLGIRPSLEAVFCTVIFQLSFTAVHTVGLRQRQGACFSAPGRRKRIAARCGAIAAISILVLFSCALPLSIWQGDKLTDATYSLEGILKRGADMVSGANTEPVSGGELPRGNNYDTGAEHLVLTLSKQPTEPLYLRGFSGGNYNGSGWDETKDIESTVFDEIEMAWVSLLWSVNANYNRGAEVRLTDEEYASFGFPAGEQWPYQLVDALYHQIATGNATLQRDFRNQIRIIFDRMYFLMTAVNSDHAEPSALAVRQVSGTVTTYYTPYFSFFSPAFLGSRTAGDADTIPDYSYLFFEQKDIQIDWETDSGQLTEALWCRWLQNAYLQEIRDIYTEVPVQRLPRLRELCAACPSKDLDSVTTFILQSLHALAAYTKTPGWTPVREDPVEYFLFENGLGYCVHFASAATLMYRLCGIPARYATGYRIDPEDFLPQAGGMWQAVVTDAYAHAWTEVFLEDYGWTPVEVTPAAGDAAVGYSELDLPSLSVLLEGRNLNLPAFPGVSGLPSKRTAASGTDSLVVTFTRTLNWNNSREIRQILELTAVYLLVSLPGLWLARRAVQRKKAAEMDCRAQFTRLLTMLDDAGLFPGWDGQEADFPDQLARAVSTVSPAEAQQLCGIVQKAAFGGIEPSAAENRFAREFFCKTAAGVYPRLRWWKRLLFRYWYGYDATISSKSSR